MTHDGRYPLRISSPGQPPMDATLVISGRAWSLTMYPWNPTGATSPLTISGESDDARAALLLLAGADAVPFASPPPASAASIPATPEPAVSTPAPQAAPAHALPAIADAAALGESPVLDVVGRLRVYQADSPKIRLGSTHDGGYVIPESLLRESSALVSIGIAHDSRFEEDWFELTGKPVEMFDGSCDCPAICSRWPAERNARITYTRRFVGNDPEMVTLGSILAGRQDVLLKMDAEGAEYPTLPRVDLSRCSGILLEVHFLTGEQGQRDFARMLDQINRDFVLVHVHGNNCCGSAQLPAALSSDGDGLPSVLELTFVNRRAHHAPLALSKERFPIPGLDTPNNPALPDLMLDWVNRYLPDGHVGPRDRDATTASSVSIVDSGRRDPDRGVVYHIATGGLVHLLHLLGNSLSYAEAHRAVIAPVFELGYEWGAVPFRDFFQTVSPAIADAPLQTQLLDELPQRLRLPIASLRDVRTGWIDDATGDCLDLVGDLAGALTLGLPWGTNLEPGQAILTGGGPWPPDGTPRGYEVALERIAVNDRVRGEIARRTAGLPDRYIGVHFRNTDALSDLAEVTARARQAADETGIADILWVTDDIDTLPEAQDLLPDLRLHRASDLPGFRGTGFRALHFMSPEHLATLGLTKDDIQLATVSDMYVLIRADVFVPTGAPVVGIGTGWTGFVEHLRARPETAESFFRLPVIRRPDETGTGDEAAEAMPPVPTRSREDLHVPAEEAIAVRDLLLRRRESGEAPEPSALPEALERLELGDSDRDAFEEFVAFAEPLAPFSSAPAFEDLWAVWEAKGRTPGFFVEIGGGTGRDDSATYLLERRARWGGILVEPDAALADAARMNRNCLVCTAWVSAAPDGAVDLAAVEADGGRRLVRIDHGKRAGRRTRKPTVAATVEAMTLDAVLAAASAPARIDFLCLRSGDAPADLLRGFDFARWDVRTIAIGANAAGDADDLTALLREAGYREVWPEFSEPARWYTRD